MSDESPEHGAATFEKTEPLPVVTFSTQLADFLRAWWLRLALGALGLVLALYLGVISLLYYRASTVDAGELTWGDFALAPFRWAEFREKQGRMLNARGLKRFETGRYSEAFFDLRAGLSRSPREIAPRVTLAGLYIPFNVEQAANELENALQMLPGDPDLAEALLLLHRRFGATAAALEFTATERVTAATGRFRAVLVAQRAEILLGLGRAREAREVLALMPTEFQSSPQCLDVTVRAAIADSAFAEAQSLLAVQGAALAAAQRAKLEFELVRARGDEAALSSALRRVPVSPEFPYEAELLAFATWHRLHRMTLRDRARAELFDLHDTDPEAMKRFGALLVALRDTATLLTTIARLEERGMDTVALQAQATELALREGRFLSAFRTLERWESALTRYKGVERSDAEFVRRLTRAACDESSAQATLLGSYLAGLPSALAYPRYTLALDVLPRAGMVDAAAAIAGQARRKFPRSDAFAAKATELETILATRRDQSSKQRAVATEEAQRRFADADATLAGIADTLKSGDAPRVRSTLRDLRNTRPAWLVGRERDVSFLEISVALLVDEPAEAREVVRRGLQVFTDEATSLRLLGLAQELDRARPIQARLLREEVAEHGHRSDAVAEALSRVDWQDATWRSVREAATALQAMDEALARRDPDHVLRVVGLARRAAPAWLPSGVDAVALRELRARLQLHQKGPAAVLLRDLVRRGEASRAMLYGLIRELAMTGDYEDALFLATKWNELSPEDRRVADMLGNLRIKAPL